MAERKRIFIVGTRVLSYPRNRTLARAFEVLGDVRVTEYTPSLRLQWDFFFHMLRPASCKDRLVVMYPADRFFPTLLMARLFFRGEIISDAFISAYDSWVNDRALASRWGIKAFYYTAIDQLVCLFSDTLLFDTKEHAGYFRRRYFIRGKTRTIIVPITI